MRGFHPLIDYGAELGHFEEGGLGDAAGGDVFFDGLEFGLGGVIVIFHAFDAAENFGEIESLDGDAGVLE